MTQDVVMESGLDAFKKGLGQNFWRKSQAKIGRYSLLFYEVGYIRMPNAREGTRKQVSCMLPEASGGPLWNTGSWTSWAFGLILWGTSYVICFLHHWCHWLSVVKLTATEFWGIQLAILGPLLGTISLEWFWNLGSIKYIIGICINKIMIPIPIQFIYSYICCSETNMEIYP